MVLLFENGFSGRGQFLQSFCRTRPKKLHSWKPAHSEILYLHRTTVLIIRWYDAARNSNEISFRYGSNLFVGFIYCCFVVYFSSSFNYVQNWEKETFKLLNAYLFFRCQIPFYMVRPILILIQKLAYTSNNFAINLIHRHEPQYSRGEATRDMTNSLVLLQKLCKNCPRPKKPFSNSKTISLYITYKNKLFKNQNWLKTEFWKIDKLTEMKNSSNDRVMRKNPLQVTLKSFANQKKLVKSQSGHTEKPFADH